MKWLIVEDALRDRWGHWYEYLSTFKRGLAEIGDEVTFFCDRKAESFILSEFDARPVLPESIWHRMSDGAGALVRYARVPLHALATFFALRKMLANASTSPGNRNTQPATSALPDVIFVPTVLVHHLLGWWLLLSTGAVPSDSHVLLFFPNLPLRVDESGKASWNGSPTTKLMAWLFRKMRPWVVQRKVILGVETEPMRRALAQLIGMPVVYLPHPVEVPEKSAVGSRQLADGSSAEPILFACYGVARAEKGSDVFQEAIRLILRKESSDERRASSHGEAEHATGHPLPVTSAFRPTRFAIQWIDDFSGANGKMACVSDELLRSDRVEVIRHFFEGDGYARQLARTDAMVLPYQSRSYRVRVSRVVIEAMVRGLPVVVTEGTTMWDQVRHFGTGVPFAEGDAASLADAICHMAHEFDAYRTEATGRIGLARDHFSVANFKRLFLGFVDADGLVLGDSHVAGWDWPNLKDGLWSYGLPGATSQDLLARIEGWSVPQPERAILWVGTNDALQAVPPEVTAGNTKRLIEKFPRAKRAGATALLEVLPLGPSVPGAAAINGLIRQLNLFLEGAALESGAKFVKCAGAVTGRNGFLEDRYSADGTHLNDEGYEKIAALLSASLPEDFFPKQP